MKCFFKILLLQVLHGCRQSVLWEVRLTPLTDEILVVNLYLTINGTDRVSFRAKTSRYGLMNWAIDVHKNFYKVMRNHSLKFNMAN